MDIYNIINVYSWADTDDLIPLLSIMMKRFGDVFNDQRSLLDFLYRFNVYTISMIHHVYDFPKSITSVPRLSLLYSMTILKSRFPQGEEVILKCPNCVYEYIINVLKTSSWLPGMRVLKEKRLTLYYKVLNTTFHSAQKRRLDTNRTRNRGSNREYFLALYRRLL